MTETNEIDSLQDAALVLTSVFVSIFLIISFIWIIKYYCCPSTEIVSGSNTSIFAMYDTPMRNTGTSGEQSPNHTSEHPIVPFSTKVRSIFLEKVLQHETFHPHKTSTNDDVEKGIHITKAIARNIDDDHPKTIDDMEYGPEQPAPSTAVFIKHSVDSIYTDNNVVKLDATMNEYNVSECEATAISKDDDDDDSFVSDNHHRINTGDPNDSSSTDNINESCAICYDTLQDGDEITTSNCAKTFHRACIITWLMQHDTCPYCRNTFKNINDNQNIDAILANEIIDCD